MHNIFASRKIVWPAAIVLAAVYFGPSILHFFLPVALRSAQVNVVQPKSVRPSVGSQTPTATVPVAPGTATNASESVPSADPVLPKMLGKWGGQVALERGMCALELELYGKDDNLSFSGSSRLSCAPSVFDLLAKRQGKNPTPAETVTDTIKAINPTSASFTGTVKDGAILLQAVDNIGVREAVDGCPMVSMTVREFGDARISVKWQEDATQNHKCKGGETILAHR